MQADASAAEEWERYQIGQNLYAQKLVKEGVYPWQIDTVPNEKTGRERKIGGHPDLFKLFTERFLVLAATGGGRMGLLMPVAFYASEGCKGLRRMILENARIQHLYSYENRRLIFPAVDSRFKFCALVVTKTEPDEDAEFPAAFMLHDPGFLDASLAQQTSRIVTLSPRLIREQSPTHLSFFEFRNEQEKTVVQRIYEQFPPLGRELDDTWNVSFTQEQNMTTDSWLFRERDRLRQFGGTQHAGEYWTLPDKDWFEGQPEKFAWVSRTESELRGKPKPKGKKGASEQTFEGFVLKDEEDERSPQIMVSGSKYVPLYEGRMVHQFDHAAKAYVGGSGRRAEWRDLEWDEKEIVPHYFLPLPWLPLEPRRTRGAYCRITGQTNERSLQAAIIGTDASPGDPVPTFWGEEAAAHVVVVALMNSLSMDWVVRFQIAMHIDLFMIKIQPFARPALDEGIGAELVSLCRKLHDCGDERASLRSRLDALVCQLYGLEAKEVAMLLTGFPLLDRDQPWLPGDGFIASDKKGKPKFKPRSFVTRDKVLLEYFRLLGETPPDDIVAFFAEAGVDIDGGKVLGGEPPADPFNPPICATGPIRNLEERVRLAEQELGAVAYVPTVRQKPTEEGLARSKALAERFAREPVEVANA